MVKWNARWLMILTRFFNSECFICSVLSVSTIKFGIVELECRISQCPLKSTFFAVSRSNLCGSVVYELCFALVLDLIHSFSKVTCLIPHRGWDDKLRHLKQSGDAGKVNPIPFHPLDEKSIRACIGNSDLVINLVESTTQPRICIFEWTTRIPLSLQIPRHPIDILERLARICNELCKTRLLLVSVLQPNHHPGSEWVRSKGTRLFPSKNRPTTARKCSAKSCPAPASCVLRTGSAKMTACWPGRTAGKGW